MWRAGGRARSLLVTATGHVRSPPSVGRVSASVSHWQNRGVSMRRSIVCVHALAVLAACACPCATRADTETARPLDGSTDFWRTRQYCGVTTVYMMLKLYGVELPYE